MSLSTNASTIAESTYREIRKDIIFGRLAPSEKLRLDKLRTRYGTSVSTLREVLNRLAADGLVRAEGQRGFEVAPVSEENLREISALRHLLEGYALELSFAAGEVEWEAKVVAAHYKLHQTELAMIAGDRSVTETWKRYDWEFHQALISACGSRTLMETHATVFDKYLRYQMLALTFRGQIAADEHMALRDAALAHDAEKAKALLERHIIHSLAERSIRVAAE